ncbi:MAG: hypothetical protein Q4G14_10495 [Paracoccus sp. (in: a-proteobacteria)]|uniref:hypothetical protein n=1 Tax=Paracoccus sp. TaxID=267 RepID=UPI0026E09298|nr:hypothetical protein [Paracoccus sp. (in: a-proteobacteria)]MDO5613653.1 hypothetical protein [Paracoccus sp. (in: a-proteobacteria)]
MIAVADTSLYVAEAGRRDGVPVVLLLNLAFAGHTLAEDQPDDLLPALRQLLAGAWAA